MKDESAKLFHEIDTFLEGSKHYTVEEIKENESNFIQAIESKDIEYLQEYYPLLQEEHINKIERMLSL
jgi:hypothetical protein